MKPAPRRANPSAYILMEMMVVIAITGIFLAATAPTLHEMLNSLRLISHRESLTAAQDTWANHLRADLWAGRQVTLITPNSPAITIPAAAQNPTLPPITWTLDPAAAITRSTTAESAPPQDAGHDHKTFRPMAKSITLQTLPGALRLTITQHDLPEPTLYTFPLQSGAKP
jgi:type II secretory pathway pseudopilin PulG